MDSSAALALLSLPLAFCFVEWRAGVLISIFVGFAQDPIRKSIAGEPLYFTVAVGGFLLVTCLGAYRRGVTLSFAPIYSWYDVLRSPLKLFLAIVFIQSVVTFFRFGSPVLAAIGVVAYMAPLPGILIGYYFSRRSVDVRKFIGAYLALSAVATFTIYLSYLGYDWAIFRQVGTGIVAYGGTKGIITLHSGLMRSPEIAAWHAGTSACLTIIFILSSRRSGRLMWFIGALMPFFTFAVLFTGRRKHLMEIVLFIAGYVVLLLWFQHGSSRAALTLAVAVAIGLVALNVFGLGYFDLSGTGYLERGTSIREDSALRLWDATFGAFQYVIAANGIAGSGAGTGSQGSQYYGGGDTGTFVGAAAEGGLGKIIAELGVPGFAVLVWLAVRLVKYIRRIIEAVRATGGIKAKLAYGILALLAANTVVFATAHQVFGDLFVLIILGFLLGALLAIPRMSESERSA